MTNHRCSNVFELVDGINHNTKVFVRGFKLMNKKTNCLVTAGILYMIAMGYCAVEQNRKINELTREIREFKEKEGD